MMKRLMVVALALGALAAFAAPTYAGIFRRGCCEAAPACGTCATPCSTPCAQQVTYVDKQVTVCKPVWVDEKVTRTVMEQHMVTKDVPCTYTVMQQFTEKQKRTVTENVMTTKDVPYTYTVMERQMQKQKRDRKSTRLNSSHSRASRMPSSA